MRSPVEALRWWEVTHRKKEIWQKQSEKQIEEKRSKKKKGLHTSPLRGPFVLFPMVLLLDAEQVCHLL